MAVVRHLAAVVQDGHRGVAVAKQDAGSFHVPFSSLALVLALATFAVLPPLSASAVSACVWRADRSACSWGLAYPFSLLPQDYVPPPALNQRAR